MRDKPEAGKLSRTAKFVCLVLAFSVFAWGLGYKLDCYETADSAIHKLPKAKLLSKNEQTWVADAARNAPSKALMGPPKIISAGFLIALLAAFRQMDEPAPVHLAWQAVPPVRPSFLIKNHLFVRPPPVQA